MKRIVLSLSILLIFLLTGTLSAAAQDTTDQCMQRGGFWNTDHTQCTVHLGYDIQINYPMTLIDYPFAQDPIDTFIGGLRDDFVQNYNKTDVVTASFPWTLNVDYAAFQHGDNFRSIQLTIYEYTGGAHGTTAFQTYTFDLANQRVLTLDDLFTDTPTALATIDPLVEKDLSDQIGAEADTGWIPDGTGTNPDNYQNFALSTDSLMFFFPQYQVGPGSWGTFTVGVPFSQIQSVLAPDIAGS